MPEQVQKVFESSFLQNLASMAILGLLSWNVLTTDNLVNKMTELSTLVVIAVDKDIPEVEDDIEKLEDRLAELEKWRAKNEIISR